MSNDTDFDLSVDLFELMDVSDEEYEEFLEQIDDLEPVVEDYVHAMEQELESLNETPFMEKMQLRVIMDYSLEVQPRS